MPAKVKRIPDGYHTATPYLIIQGAAAALEFYEASILLGCGSSPL